MTKEEREQFKETQRLIDEMNKETPQDSNTDVHSKINTAMDAFSAAEEELKRKEMLRKKITGQ